MLNVYVPHLGRLDLLDGGEALASGCWIDVFRPEESEVQRLRALGINVPSLDAMEEIEISNRLYREEAADYMTAVLPGALHDGRQVAMPVTFILTRRQLVTVRHHQPRPFITFPGRAGHSAAGIASADQIFLGLIEEVVSRLADLLEGVGRKVEATSQGIFADGDRIDSAILHTALITLSQQSEVMARVRQGLLSIERVISFYTATIDDRDDTERLRMLAKAQNRDVQALEVHADFLGSRVALTLDATLGLINLAQNNTVRVLSVMAALFLPPSVIASIFGMNFDKMPELHWTFGYPLALGAMLVSALAIYLLARWRRWL